MYYPLKKIVSSSSKAGYLIHVRWSKGFMNWNKFFIFQFFVASRISFWNTLCITFYFVCRNNKYKRNIFSLQYSYSTYTLYFPTQTNWSRLSDLTPLDFIFGIWLRGETKLTIQNIWKTLLVSLAEEPVALFSSQKQMTKLLGLSEILELFSFELSRDTVEIKRKK